ncbi:MAG: DUF4837 family protein [Candidatus Delongbacteria bacterium]|nr:DUF4837 family protein [Candidatus Delongbacteria bacterium]
MIKRIHWLLLLLSLLLLWSGCGQPRSWGDWDEITVFVDSLDRKLVEPQLRAVFEAHSISPQLEPWFRLNFVDSDQMNALTNRRLLLFIGSRIDAVGPVNSYVRSLFPVEVLERIRAGEPLLFAREHALARPQQVVILPAVDPAGVKALLAARDSSLVQLFLDFTRERVQEQLYDRFEQKELADSLRNMLQVNLRIPHDYQVVNALPEQNLLRFRRYYPDRWIAVQVLPGLPQDMYDPTYLLDLRDSLGVHFHDKVYVERDPDFFRVTPVVLDGTPAVCLEGLWGTFELIGGGPYILFLVPDHTNNRTILLDGAVLAPGKDKNQFLHHLWSILNTYKQEN